MAKYTIIIEKGEGNYSAYCPDLPGVVSAGDTEEETAELMKEAIKVHLEELKEDRIPIPKPTISARYVEVVV
jgi:predicted RNase H-like HicB family nuclease